MSVAGETEEVAGVVDELVDVHVLAEDRDGALVDADEVVGGEREERGADQPQHGLRDRQDDRRGGRAGCGNAAQGEPSFGDRASLFHGRRDERLSDSPSRLVRRRDHSGATVLDFHQLPHVITTRASVGLRSVMRQSGRTGHRPAFPAACDQALPRRVAGRGGFRSRGGCERKRRGKLLRVIRNK